MHAWEWSQFATPFSVWRYLVALRRYLRPSREARLSELWNRAESLMFSGRQIFWGVIPQFLIVFYKSGSPSNMWQSLVTISFDQWWCHENFMMLSLTIQDLSCWQTDRQTNKNTDRHYWKQYHPRCAGGKHDRQFKVVIYTEPEGLLELTVFSSVNTAKNPPIMLHLHLSLSPRRERKEHSSLDHTIGSTNSDTAIDVRDRGRMPRAPLKFGKKIFFSSIVLCTITN